jgi:hypothetical protein
MSTPSLLQDALVDEIKELFDGYELQNVKGARVPLNVYPQFLPAKQSEDDEQHFPYVIVRIADGNTPSEEDPALCKVTLIIGVYDTDDKYQGYRDVLNILRRLETHFFQKRIIDNRFAIQHPFNWAVHDEDTYPFYFGAAETNWTLPSVLYEVNYGD